MEACLIFWPPSAWRKWTTARRRRRVARRVSATGAAAPTAGLLAPTPRLVYRQTKTLAGGRADMQDLVRRAEALAALLKQRKETIAVAESSTGGLVSAALLAIPGASAYFLGGAVVYTRQARRALMDIPDQAMTGMRASTEPYALLLARTARER